MFTLSDPAGKSDILVSTYISVGPGTLCLDDVRETDEASEQPPDSESTARPLTSA